MRHDTRPAAFVSIVTAFAVVAPIGLRLIPRLAARGASSTRAGATLTGIAAGAAAFVCAIALVLWQLATAPTTDGITTLVALDALTVGCTATITYAAAWIGWGITTSRVRRRG